MHVQRLREASGGQPQTVVALLLSIITNAHVHRRGGHDDNQRWVVLGQPHAGRVKFERMVASSDAVVQVRDRRSSRTSSRDYDHNR